MISGTSTNALAKFTVEKGGDAYQLHIESDDGETLELSASFEQFNLLADALNKL